MYASFYTQPVRTIFLFKSIWTRSQGSQGCHKIRFYFSKMKVLSFCAKIAPERHKLRKTIKIGKKMSKNTCFLRLFWIFFNLRAILACQTSCGMFSGSWRIFWHPWDPWGRIHSGGTRVLRLFLIFLHDSAIWRIFSFFSNGSQMSLLLIWHE